MKTRYDEILGSCPRLQQACRAAQAVSEPGPLAEVGAAVAAPLVIGYVLWVLRRATELGFERLCFVAREGQVLFKTAQLLAPRINSELQLSYLYGSRQAWNQAAISFSSPADRRWLLSWTVGLTLEQVLVRAGLEPGAVADVLRRSGFADSGWTKPLRRADLVGVARVLRDRAVRAMILVQAERSRHLLGRYLAQEGLLGTDNWALVDSGWYGNGQRSLNRVLTVLERPWASGFYIGWLRAQSCPGLGPVHTYWPDLRQGVLGRVPHLPTLVELLCQADHGSVLGFEQTPAGRVQPRLQVESAQGWRAQAAATVQTAVCAVAARFEPAGTDDLRPLSAALLERFWNTPTAAEVRTWGLFNSETDQGRLGGPLARPFGLGDVLVALRHGRANHRDWPSWPAGSWTYTDPIVQRLLTVASRPRQLLVGLRERLQPLRTT